MAIIVEDGTIVANANSYVTLAEYKSWADDRAVTYGTDAEVTASIYRAIDYLEGLSYQGDKTDEDQYLQWPRTGVSIDGYTVGHDEIPRRLKAAQYEAIKADIDGISGMNNLERQTLSETVGDISVSYSASSSSRTTSPALSMALRKLVASSNVVTRA